MVLVTVGFQLCVYTGSSIVNIYICYFLNQNFQLNELPVSKILELSELLETCDFERFWVSHSS